MESLIDLQRLTGEYLWDLGVNIVLALVILVVGRLAATPLAALLVDFYKGVGWRISWLTSPPPSPMLCSLWLSSLRLSTDLVSTQHR